MTLDRPYSCVQFGKPFPIKTTKSRVLHETFRALPHIHNGSVRGKYCKIRCSSRSRDRGLSAESSRCSVIREHQTFPQLVVWLHMRITFSLTGSVVALYHAADNVPHQGSCELSGFLQPGSWNAVDASISPPLCSFPNFFLQIAEKVWFRSDEIFLIFHGLRGRARNSFGRNQPDGMGTFSNSYYRAHSVMIFSTRVPRV